MKKIIPFLTFFLVVTCKAELRTWTAVNGKEVEAEFLSNEKGIVKLKLKSGKVFEVPLNKLSKGDQEFLKAKSSSGLLADNIVGKLMTFEIKSDEFLLQFNGDGSLLEGKNGSLWDDGMTYKIEGNEVLGFDEKTGKRVVVIFFSSTDPKVGDQFKFETEEEKMKGKITSFTTSELPDSKNTKNLKLTDKQISDHFEFWIGKWKGYNKSTNELLVTSESKWKDKGKSLETDVIVFKDGEQQDVGIGSNYYDEKIGVFVFKLVLEKQGTIINHTILNLENGELYGFPVEPIPPEGIEVTFNQKRVNLNTVIEITKVQNGDSPPVYNEILFKRQINNSEEEPVDGTKPKPEGVSVEELEPRERLVYRTGSDVPYTGKSFELYPNGNLEEVYTFKDGIPNGLMTKWYMNGQKEAEVNFKDGKPDGLVVEWYETGEKMSEVTYKDGRPVDGSEKYFEKHELTEEEKRLTEEYQKNNP